ncbi:hypothetical protein [Sphingorhabdus contaminans]
MKLIYSFAAVALVAPIEPVDASETRTHVYDELGRLISTTSSGSVNN